AVPGGCRPRHADRPAAGAAAGRAGGHRLASAAGRPADDGLVAALPGARRAVRPAGEPGRGVPPAVVGPGHLTDPVLAGGGAAGRLGDGPAGRDPRLPLPERGSRRLAGGLRRENNPGLPRVHVTAAAVGLVAPALAGGRAPGPVAVHDGADRRPVRPYPPV